MWGFFISSGFYLTLHQNFRIASLLLVVGFFARAKNPTTNSAELSRENLGKEVDKICQSISVKTRGLFDKNNQRYYSVDGSLEVNTMGEAEDRDRLFFEMRSWDSHLMVRIRAKGPYTPRPKTLERLYELLRDKRDKEPFALLKNFVSLLRSEINKKTV